MMGSNELTHRITALRQAGNLTAAVQTFVTWGKYESTDLDWEEAFREHCLSPRDRDARQPCLLLEFARKGRRSEVAAPLGPAWVFPMNKPPRTTESGLWRLASSESVALAPAVLQLLEARLLLIQAWVDDHLEFDDRVAAVDAAVMLYEQAWQECRPTTPDAEGRVVPGCLQRLPNKESRWRDLLKIVAQRAGERAGLTSPNWDHPGLLMAGGDCCGGDVPHVSSAESVCRS